MSLLLSQRFTHTKQSARVSLNRSRLFRRYDPELVMALLIAIALVVAVALT
jgi:hypothetical protein